MTTCELGESILPSNPTNSILFLLLKDNKKLYPPSKPALNCRQCVSILAVFGAHIGSVFILVWPSNGDLDGPYNSTRLMQTNSLSLHCFPIGDKYVLSAENEFPLFFPLTGIFHRPLITILFPLPFFPLLNEQMGSVYFVCVCVCSAATIFV